MPINHRFLAQTQVNLLRIILLEVVSLVITNSHRSLEPRLLVLAQVVLHPHSVTMYRRISRRIVRVLTTIFVPIVILLFSLLVFPPQNTTSALATTGTGLFGNTQHNQAVQQTQQPANPFGNLLGQNTTQPTGTSFFGSGLQSTQRQPQTSLFCNSLGPPMH